MLTNNTVLTSQTDTFFLSSYSRIFGDLTSDSVYLKIDGDTLTATGRSSDGLSAQFYVERTDVRGTLAFRFKSAKAPHKYVAVSEGNIVLKSDNESSNDSRTFLVHEIDNNFTTFQAVSSKMFLSADKDGKVFLGTANNLEREAWFEVFSEDEVVSVAKRVEFVFSSISDTSSELTTVMVTSEE